MNYAYHSLNGKKFNFFYWIASGLLAGWIGMNIALFIEPGRFQLFIASMSGFCSMPILAFLEKDGAMMLWNAFLRTF